MSSSKDIDAKEGTSQSSLRKTKNGKLKSEINNSGSLEDCNSNIYSMLELNGIKWQCYRTPANSPRGLPFNSDPILKAYSKCLQNEIMCVWRRKPIDPAKQKDAIPLPQFSHDAEKELWVFWFDEDSNNVKEFCAGLEVATDDNTFTSNTLTYEVRTLLFKALHILVERNLGTIGFIRFGRWFTQPQEPKESHMVFGYPMYTIAIRLHFLIQDVTSVCMAVDAQRQPTLIQLAKRHLEHKVVYKRVTVVLGPWSMRGVLVQDQLKLLAETKWQAKAEREYNEWMEFHQMDNPEAKGNEEKEGESGETEQDTRKDDSTDKNDEDNGDKKKRKEGKSTPRQKESTPDPKRPRDVLPKKDIGNGKSQDDAAKGEDNDDTESEYESESDNEDTYSEKGCPPADIPKMVLVEIDGIRMLYPSKYVCVTIEDDKTVWDALKIKVATIPDELNVHGRRPRNKFVVHASNYSIPTLGAFQSSKLPSYRFIPKRYSKDQKKFVKRVTKEPHLNWVFKKCTSTKCDTRAAGYQCKVCSFMGQRSYRVKKHKRKLPLLTCTETSKMCKNMVDRVLRTSNGASYHKIFSANNMQQMKALKNSKERRKLIAEGLTVMTRPPKKERKKKKSTTEESDCVRSDSDDEPWLLDASDMADWADLKKETNKVPYLNDDIPMGVTDAPSPTPSHDDSYNPEPFFPISYIELEKENTSYKVMKDDANMSEERFNEIYKEDPKNRWTSNMTRDEKRQNSNHEFDPIHAVTRKNEQLSYHLTEKSNRKHYNLEVPITMDNKFYKGEKVKYGLNGYLKHLEDIEKKIAEKEAIEAARKKEELAKMPKVDIDDYMIKACDMVDQGAVEKCIDRINIIKDAFSIGRKKTKQLDVMKLVDPKVISNKMTKGIISENAFNKIPNTEEEAGASYLNQLTGVMSPDCASSPSISVLDDEESQNVSDISDESKNSGLGEGTSAQFEEDERMEVDENEEEHRQNMDIDMDYITSDGHHQSRAEGLLSPPASNEMQKGGPLSVGPPSVEPAMNLIYPTPPSVQAEHQIHSPIHGSKLKSYEMIERVEVPGAGATIEEIDEDAVVFNQETNRKDIGKLQKRDTTTIFTKRKRRQLISDKFHTGDKGLQVRSHRNRVYSNMVNDSFKNPPYYSYGKLLHRKSSFDQTGVNPAISRFGLPPTPHSIHLNQMHQPLSQQMTHQMAPGQYHPNRMLPGPGTPFGGPMGQHPMAGNPGFPGGPMGQFGQHPMAGRMNQNMFPGGITMYQSQMMQNRSQMMPNRPHAPPAYVPTMPGHNYPQGDTNRGLQQLNNFVNQPRFQPGTGHPGGNPPPYQSMPINPSPNFPQPGYGNQMMHNMQNQGQLMRNPNGMPMTQQQQYQMQQQMMMRQHQMNQMGQSAHNMPMYPQQSMQQMMQRQQQQQNMNNQYRQQEPVSQEGESAVISVILSDTVLDLHFDTTFDACPMCSCNVTIRSRELGVYLTPHEVLRSTNPSRVNLREPSSPNGKWSGFYSNNNTPNCTCGFSAIRYRYLSLCSGLFEEDSNEATGLVKSVANVRTSLGGLQKSWATRHGLNWINPNSNEDLALLNLIRITAQTQSFGKAVAQMALIDEHMDNTTKATDIGMDVMIPSEYIMSDVDSIELLMLGNAVTDLCLTSPSHSRNKSISSQKLLTYFHPWGLQTANEIREPDTMEWMLTLETLTPVLESSMRIARKVDPTSSAVMVDGPLTWRGFVAKSMKSKINPAELEDDDTCAAEPFPAVLASTEHEAFRAAPQIVSYMHNDEGSGIGPIDQPKDVMYITLIPDEDSVYKKTVEFMDLVTEYYETRRLGKHIPFPISTPKILEDRLREKTAEEIKDLEDWEIENRVSKPVEIEEEIRKRREARNGVNFKGYPEAFEDTMEDYHGPDEKYVRPDRRSKFVAAKKKDTELAREGILRLGFQPFADQTFMQTMARTSIFDELTKHIDDKTGFVRRLRMYLEQFEDYVARALNDQRVLDRYGFKYQCAVETKYRERKDAQILKEAEINEMYRERERLYWDQFRPEEQPEQEPIEGTDIIPMVIVQPDKLPPRTRPETPTDAPPAEPPNTRQPVAEESDGEIKITPPPTPPPQPTLSDNMIPSPVPAGMVHIPETLSESEKKVQPTLEELLAEPSALMPSNAASISWTQKDTTVDNIFRYSNQPPVKYADLEIREQEDPALLPHVFVIYMFNPFNYGAEYHTALHMRVALNAFMRSYNSMLEKLAPRTQFRVQLEILGLESLDEVSFVGVPDYLNSAKIPMDLLSDSANANFPSYDDTEAADGVLQEEVAKQLAVSVYTQPRILTPEVVKSTKPRCMTAFGPASCLIKNVDGLELLNEEWFQIMNYRKGLRNGLNPYQLQQSQMFAKQRPFIYQFPCNIICLAPPPAVYDNDDKAITPNFDEQVLFISYCLIGSDYLVATATDSYGKISDNCVINIRPNKGHYQTYRFKKNSQVLDAIGKLWTFAMGVMCSDLKNWRLVIGRLGRIGHCEFKAWNHLLNKASLLKFNQKYKDTCMGCNNNTGIGTPSILSACLVSIEPEPSLRVFPNYFDIDVMASKKGNLHTPDDLSCTHIVTFPVGADISLDTQNQTADAKDQEDWEFGDLDIGLDEGDNELLTNLGDEVPPTSAPIRENGVLQFFTDEVSLDVQNQPLASGFYVSTAPARELPEWFWATCPSAKRSLPVHLKSSLHINISEVKNDDIAMEAASSSKDKEKEKDEKDLHPLESRLTEDVLRHVLESYNALSWLNVHPDTGERYSCMPIHIQHLLRLYHSVLRLVV